MSPIVGTQAGDKESDGKDGHYRGDQPSAKCVHVGAAAPRSNGDEQADQTENGAAGSHGRSSAEFGAHDGAAEAADGVAEKVASRTVDLLDCGADVHERHHVKTDVYEPAVQIHGGEHAVPIEIVIAEWNAHAEAV